MKRRTGILICLILIITCAAALGDVKIDEKNFPNEEWREVVLIYDKNGDGYLSESEASPFGGWDVAYSDIKTLKGIEYFPNTNEIDCYNCKLESLDVSKNTKLTVLNVHDNNLKTLDVSKNPKLNTLLCYHNPLKTLDISKNKELVKLVKSVKPKIQSYHGYGWWIDEDGDGYPDYNTPMLFVDENVKIITKSGTVFVSSIKLNKAKVSLKKGKTQQLSVSALKPANASSKKVKWSSDNPKVAKVNKNGKVTAKGKGTCTITCEAADGSGTSATCKVTVK